MSSGLYSGVSGLALGVGLYRSVSGLWSGSPGLLANFGTGGGLPTDGSPTLIIDFVLSNTSASPSLITDFTTGSYATTVRDPVFPNSFVDIQVWI